MPFFKDISGVLTHIINISFEHSIFPDRWKLAIIKPIPKILCPLKASDFRPISILPALSKIIEKLAGKYLTYCIRVLEDVSTVVLEKALLYQNLIFYPIRHGAVGLVVARDSGFIFHIF